MIVNLDNSIRLIAHLRYHIPDGYNHKEDRNVISENRHEKCDSTMVGWVQMVGEESSISTYPVQCMFGKKHYNPKGKVAKKISPKK